MESDVKCKKFYQQQWPATFWQHTNKTETLQPNSEDKWSEYVDFVGFVGVAMMRGRIKFVERTFQTRYPTRVMWTRRTSQSMLVDMFSEPLLLLCFSSFASISFRTLSKIPAHSSLTPLMGTIRKTNTCSRHIIYDVSCFFPRAHIERCECVSCVVYFFFFHYRPVDLVCSIGFVVLQAKGTITINNRQRGNWSARIKCVFQFSWCWLLLPRVLLLLRIVRSTTQR